MVKFALLFMLLPMPLRAASHSIVEPYRRVLSAFVHSGGRVDYRALKENRGDLDRYLESVAALPGGVYDAYSREAKIALGVNVYNAATLQTIVDHYPIRPSFFKSLAYPQNNILQIGGAVDEIPHVVMGDRYKLDRIENGVLRKRYSEPRIHFALVCASRGCPPIRNEPYTEERLTDQLDEQVHIFLKSAENLRIDQRSRRIQVSSIFKWFRTDFEKSVQIGDQFRRFPKAEGAVRAFLFSYTKRPETADPSSQVTFLPYDWTLNEVSK